MNPATRRATLSVLLAVAAAAVAGCGSNAKQSLVLAELKLSMPGMQASGLQSVMLAADPGPMKTYGVTTLSGDQGVVLGLYIPGSITGQVTVTATAAPSQGCDGFRGTSVVTIDTAGITKSITILMDARDICGATGTGGNGGSGGTTGTGGTTGSAGAGGTTGSAGRGGTTGTAGSGGTTGTGGMAGYPSISSCRSFNHCAASSCNNSIRAVAISPNGQLVASAGNDGRVKIWNFDGHNLTNSTTALTGFTGYGMAFSPDGTLLAYPAGTKVVSYSVSGWTPSTTYLNDGSSNDIVSVGFTPNSQRVVTVNAIGSAGGDLFVHNVGTAIPALTAHIAKQPASLAVSPVAAADGSVGIAVGTYNASIAALTLGANTISSPTVLAPSSAASVVWAVGFTVDGANLVMGDDEGAVRFWGFPITSTTPVGTDIKFAGGDTINALAFSPNGMYMAVGGAFSVAQLSIYTVSTRAESARTMPASDIQAVAFSPSGTSLVAGEYDKGIVIVCD